jgi:hypothetical protein
VAATPDGGAIVAWTRTFPRKRMGTWVARMRPSGHFGRSHRLVRGGFPELAIGPDGRGVLAWGDGVRIVARVRHANGTWGPVEHVATHRPALGSGVDTIDVAAGGRRFAVGIVETVRSATGVRVLPSVHVRVGRGDWRARRLADFTFMTDATTAYVTNEPRVLPVVTADGALHAAWPAPAGGHVRVMAGQIVTRGGSLAVANRQALSPPTTHARVDDIAAGPSGAFAVAWLDASNGTTTPGVAEVDAAGVPHATIGFAGESASIDTQVAYNPRSARPTVLWSEGSTLGARPFAWTIPAR